MENDDIDFLSQPFLTEDGFVNEACMKELNEAIRNIPPTYVRLKNDSEWNSKRCTSIKDIVGAFAKWAVQQSPFCCPDGLQNVLSYLYVCLKKDVGWDSFGYAELSLVDINHLLYDILMEKGISSFDSWNVPEKDWRKEGKDGFPQDNPDYDFIDLHALLHNVCLDIRLHRRESDAFNKKFEEEHGKDWWKNG
jgi:hypothetical protein